MRDLELEAAIAALLPPGRARTGEILCLERVGSTNTALKELAAEGAPQGTVMIAGEQTAGRGRLGRSFHSPAGQGLYLSMVLRPPCAPEEFPRLTPWAAVATAEAVESCGGLRPGIKWVNDLILGGRKMCGILTELGRDAAGGWFAVVGVGIDLAQSREDFAAQGLEEIATSLAAEGAPGVGRDRMAAALIAALDGLAEQFSAHGAGWLARYRARCVTVGRRVLVLRGEESRPALALGVEEDFALRVRYDGGGEELLRAGEVSVRGLMGVRMEERGP